MAQVGSSACSASMKAPMPPDFWALAITCNASVVLPLDSGPNNSTTRPRGTPRPPNARSSDKAPVGIPEIPPTFGESDSFIIAPLPKAFSICPRALSSIPSESVPAGISRGGDCFFVFRLAIVLFLGLLDRSLVVVARAIVYIPVLLLNEGVPTNCETRSMNARVVYKQIEKGQVKYVHKITFVQKCSDQSAATLNRPAPAAFRGTTYVRNSAGQDVRQVPESYCAQCRGSNRRPALRSQQTIPAPRLRRA